MPRRKTVGIHRRQVGFRKFVPGKLGNYSYGLAVMVLPFYGGLYLASLLAERLGQSHLAWAGRDAGAGGVVVSAIAVIRLAAARAAGQAGRAHQARATGYARSRGAGARPGAVRPRAL